MPNQSGNCPDAGNNVWSIYKVDDEAHVGFIAEDVPDLVATGDRKGLSAMDIVAVLTKVVQQQQKELSAEHDEIDMLKAQLAVGQRGSR